MHLRTRERELKKLKGEKARRLKAFNKVDRRGIKEAFELDLKLTRLGEGRKENCTFVERKRWRELFRESDGAE